MLQPGARIGPALVAQAENVLEDVIVVGRDDATLARGHLLVGIEREDRRRPVGADLATLTNRAECLCPILDDREPVALGDRRDRLDVAGLAEDVHRDDRLGAWRDRGLERGGIDVERDGIDVGEGDVGTGVQRAVGRRDKRERRGDHLVTRAHTGTDQTEMQASSATRHRCRVLRTYPVREGALEARPHGAEREHPRVQHLEDQLLLAGADVRLREGDWCAGGAHVRRETRGRSSTARGDRGPCRRTSSGSAS